MSFQITTEKERKEALGEETKFEKLFHPLLKKTEWLEDFADKRQNFHQYTKIIEKGKQGNSMSKEQNIVYITYLNGKPISWLTEFIKVNLFPVKVEEIELGNSSNQVNDLNLYLKSKLPKDGYCLIGITDVDLKIEGFNYIIGKATLRDRVGVVSYARYTPKWKGYLDSDLPFEWRLCNTVLHEICHSFAIAHCVYYHCVMNGSNTGDDRPLLLCPICEKKLIFNIEKSYKVNHQERIKGLLKCYQNMKFPESKVLGEIYSMIKNDQ